MATVDKKTADNIVAGALSEDGATRIVEYDNAFGGVSYGVTFEGEPKDRYLEETEFVRNPRIYWDRDGETSISDNPYDLTPEAQALIAEIKKRYGDAMAKYAVLMLGFIEISGWAIGQVPSPSDEIIELLAEFSSAFDRRLCIVCEIEPESVEAFVVLNYVMDFVQARRTARAQASAPATEEPSECSAP